MISKLFLPILCLLLLLSCLFVGSVGASSEMWSQTYGGEFIDHATSLVETSDGGYVLAGVTSFPVGIGSSYFLLIKTDAYGVIDWNQTYEGEAAYAHELVETSDGGYALAGTRCTDENYFDFWLVKTDAYGNMVWNQTYGGPNIDQASSLVQTGDGGFALAGYTESFGSGDHDCWLIKTDAEGNMVWNQTYGGEGMEVASSLVETSDGGYALGGQTSPETEFDFSLIKTDSYGNMEWNQTFGGTGWDQAYSMVETSDGGYALAGRTNSLGAGSYDAWLVKTDSNGNMQWNQTYGGTGWDEAQSLVETSDDGFALAGRTNSFGAGDYDFWLVKTDPYGNMEWNQTYGGPNRDQALAVVQTSDDGFILAGKTTAFDRDGDFWLIKTDEQGIIPEFPSWAPLLFVFSIVAVVVVVYKRKLSSTHQLKRAPAY
jgi:predicted secreted protein